MADENKDKEFKLAEDPSFKKLVETMGTLGTMVKQGQESNAALVEQIKGLTTSITDGNKPPPDPDPDEDDVDDMPNSKLVAHILKSVEDVVGKQVGELSKDLKDFKLDIDTKDSKSTVQKFAEEHKDVYDWSDEIKKMFQETPGISIGNAYKLARMDNPEKATELDEKYSDEPKKEETTPFGGLTPTSGKGLGDEAPEDEKDMDVDKAANLAWETALEEFPALAGE